MSASSSRRQCMSTITPTSSVTCSPARYFSTVCFCCSLPWPHSAFSADGGLGSLLFVLIDPTVRPPTGGGDDRSSRRFYRLQACSFVNKPFATGRKQSLPAWLALWAYALRQNIPGLVSFGCIGAFGLAALLWRFRHNARTALRRSAIFLTRCSQGL